MAPVLLIYDGSNHKYTATFRLHR